MLEAVFPPHVAALLQRGHRLLVESFDRVCLLALRLGGFRRLCAGMPLPAAVERVCAEFAAADRVLRAAGAELLDVSTDTYYAMVPLPCAPAARLRCATADVMARLAPDMCSSVACGSRWRSALRM